MSNNTAQLILSPNGVSFSTGPFGHHAPKPAGVSAVKLTEQSRDRIAEHIRGAQKDRVTAGDEYIAIGRLTISDGYPIATGAVFHIGDWIIEKYNYVHDYTYFVKATAAEREKYDLR